MLWLSVFVAALARPPVGRANKRALLEYNLFGAGYVSLQLLYSLLLLALPRPEDAVWIVVLAATYWAFTSLAIFRLLLADTGTLMRMECERE